jgi:hypothetical protein
MLPETLRHYWSGDVLAANVMHACKVDVRMACWVRMFWPPITEIPRVMQPSFALRASEGTFHNASVGRVMKGGGDGRVNSPRQYSISGRFAPIPPFFSRRLDGRLHPCAPCYDLMPHFTHALAAITHPPNSKDYQLHSGS